MHSAGGGIYLTFDTARRFGGELDFQHLSARNDSSAQTTFEAAGRYIFLRRPRLAPYVRAGIGHGSYSYPQNSGSVGYLLYGLGAGVDVHLSRYLNVRAAYEYQSWLNVPIRNPQPQAVSLGVAYRFLKHCIARTAYLHVHSQP